MKFMKRLVKIFLVVFATFALIAASCEKPEPTPEPTFDVAIVLPDMIDAYPSNNVTFKVKDGKAPLTTDAMILTPTEEGRILTCTITSSNSKEISVKMSKNLVKGEYVVSIKREMQEVRIGKTYFNIVKPTDFKPQPESTAWGWISCDDKGVAGVAVSDGVEVVVTNGEGYWEMKSKKERGYVFMSVPSGYEVPVDGVLPHFSNKLLASPTTVERSDFELKKATMSQDNHTMLFLGDIHLANRTNDRTQFRVFTNEVAAYRNEHPRENIYAMSLGDMTWDLYWYSRNYTFPEYLKEYNNVLTGFPIFHTIGNHDHDMNATGDWDTVLRYHNDMCPSFYSFNIGKIHYIAIDDIKCTNKTASQTDGSVREYEDYVVEAVLNWIKKDLALVDKSTPVVVTMHAPVYTKDGGNSLNNAAAFTALFNGYNVTFVSGHSHVLYTVDKSSSIREHNNGAICAAWWWAGKYCPTYNISTDGSPSGYRVMSVKGTQMDSYFKAVGRSDNYQFRAYDRNKINIDLSMVPSASQTALTKELAITVPYGNYSGGSSSNEIIINVWDWNKNWKVEVTENGKALTVTQKTLMDPSFFLAYTLPHLNAGNTSVSWHPNPTNHMFTAKASSATSTLVIKVTDDEGRVYTETMTRPRAFSLDSYK